MKIQTALILIVLLLGEGLMAAYSPLLCKANFKKTVMPPDCRYNTSDPLWTRPQEGEWSRDVGGSRSGLVNIYVHGSLEAVANALVNPLNNNGWVAAALNKFADNEKYIIFVGFVAEVDALKDLFKHPKFINSALAKISNRLEKTVHTMPVSNEYFCQKMQVAAFEADNRVLKGRHHLRVFSTGKVDQQNNPVWAIAANHDTGLKFDIKRPKQGFINHKIERDTDNERDDVGQVLVESGAQEMPAIPISLSCPAPRDGATSEDHQALEYYL